MAEQVLLRKEKVYKQRREADIGDFRSLYRFSKENVQWLAEYFLSNANEVDFTETRGGALTNIQKMKTYLRYMADPGFQTGIGEELGIQQSTVSRTVDSVMNKIIEKANDWIRFPNNAHEIAQAKQEWQIKYNFPSALGVVDCTHVQIEKPSLHGDEYVNRKGYASINVQATCNAREMFTSLDVSWPGSVHDARIWSNSEVRNIIRNFPDTVLLGDEGYGLEPWVMATYRNPDTENKQDFNRLLRRERVIIERCFGQVKRRFPIIK